MKSQSLKSKQTSAILGVLALIVIVTLSPHALAQQSQADQGQGGIPLGPPYNNPQTVQTQPTTQQPSTNPAGQGQQSGIPLGGPYNNPQTVQTSSNVQQQSLPNPSGQGQQSGIPLGPPYGTTQSPASPDATVMGLSVGVAVVAAMSGIGVWTAVRKH